MNLFKLRRQIFHHISKLVILGEQILTSTFQIFRFCSRNFKAKVYLSQQELFPSLYSGIWRTYFIFNFWYIFWKITYCILQWLELCQQVISIFWFEYRDFLCYLKHPIMPGNFTQIWQQYFTPEFLLKVIWFI